MPYYLKRSETEYSDYMPTVTEKPADRNDGVWVEGTPDGLLPYKPFDPLAVQAQIAGAFGLLPVEDQKVILPLLTANKLALDYGNVALVAANIADFTPQNEAQQAFISGAKQLLGIPESAEV